MVVKIEIALVGNDVDHRFMLVNSNHSPLYAVIDLGSNSFHMLIARLVADSVQIVDKVKRKVRLASGLNTDNHLSETAIARGIECLSFFAERLQDIPPNNIRVVATATLRIAINADDFLQQAQQTLGHKITLLSGQQEAEQIYLGVAHTSCSEKQRLVIDIGGASTEIIAGEAFTAKQVCSLNIGCVTYNQIYFQKNSTNNELTKENFLNAICAAKKEIKPIVASYQAIGWHSVLGGSGTTQALGEILRERNKPAIITLPFLQEIMAHLIACQQIKTIDIKGLVSERKPVFASGVAILIALFESLKITQLQLSSGAVREGLLYEMLPNMRAQTIRQRTIQGLIERFHIDRQHGKRVLIHTETLFDQLANAWQLKKDNSYQLLLAGCMIHEIGLLLEYKYHRQHGAYIIQNTDLPGFDQAERQFLVTLVRLHKGDIDHKLLTNQSVTNDHSAGYLLTILRLAIVLCRRRCDDVLPCCQCQVSNNNIHLSLPNGWLKQHPLIADELKQEDQHLQTIGLSLTIKAD